MMSWGEAHRLVLILLRDSSSQVAAAVRGWSGPIAQEDIVLRDIFDLQHQSKAKRKPKPYQRPWDPKPDRLAPRASMSVAEFRALKARLEDQG